MAYQPNRRRHPASKALIELRKALNMTQAQFATRLLKMAAVTLSLYETTNPPSATLLQRLQDIAKREAERSRDVDPAKYLKLEKLKDEFRRLLIDETLTELKEAFGRDGDSGMTLIRATDEDPIRAYFVLQLDTVEDIVSMQTLMALRKIARSDAKNRDAAVKAIEELNRALQKIKPGEYEENLADAKLFSTPRRLKVADEREGSDVRQ